MSEELRSPIVSLADHPRARPRKLPEPFAPRITLVSDLAAREVEAPEWLIDGIIPKGLTLLAGRGGNGKTTLCQMMQTCCTFAIPWLGLETKRCKSFALYTEDEGPRLHERQQRICTHYDVDMFDFEDTAGWMAEDYKEFVLYETPRRHDFTGNPTFLWQQVTKHIRDTGIELLILDNVRTVFRGDRWSDAQVDDFVRFLKKQAHVLGIAIVLLIHPPKDGSSYFKGSGAWEDAVRHTIVLERADPDDETRNEFVLQARKSNYMSQFHPMRQYGVPLEWRDDVLVVREEARKNFGVVDKLDLDNRIEMAVRSAVKSGWKIMADPRSPNSLPVRLSKQSQWQHVRRDQVASSIERLLEDGRLVKAAVGQAWLIRTPEAQYLGES